MSGQPSQTLQRLLQRHGRTYADELGIRLDGAPEGLFRLLTASLLMSARISTEIAVGAARALFARGYTDPSRMLDAGWQARVDALGEGHYVRYDESTASYLGDTATLLLEQYDGDLRRLRDAADRDPRRIHQLLQEFKGIGQVGADIFCREAQHVWGELRPFIDRRARDVAAELGLDASPTALARLYGDDDLAVVVAALLRARQEGDLDVVKAAGRDDAPPPTRTQLETMNRDELYRLAKQRQVPGRSRMRRAELLEALGG